MVASRDRKLRFFTGYGLEGVLPDGKLGRILDQYAIPEFRRGAPGDGIVAADAGRRGRDRGGRRGRADGNRARARRPLRRRSTRAGCSCWLIVILLLLALVRPAARRCGRRRYRPVLWGGGLGGIGSGGFGGGFRGGGGFGGGGGGFGGGGAGRSW